MLHSFFKPSQWYDSHKRYLQEVHKTESCEDTKEPSLYPVSTILVFVVS